jgi:small subunit ribosomal protein S2
MKYIKDKNQTLNEMLENAVHFGHYTNKWNPKMRPYIWGDRKNVHIIDLHKTVEYLDAAVDFLKKEKDAGKTILIVSTKQQTVPTVKALAETLKMPSVTYKWIPGLLTNFKTVNSRVREMKKIKTMIEDGSIDKYSKKEASKMMKEMKKLEERLGGVKDMTKKPSCFFVVDTVRDRIAVEEAKKLGIPVIGFVDTNSDPDLIDYIIPANDDAIKSVKYILNFIEKTLS